MSWETRTQHKAWQRRLWIPPAEWHHCSNSKEHKWNKLDEESPLSALISVFGPFSFNQIWSSPFLLFFFTSNISFPALVSARWTWTGLRKAPGRSSIQTFRRWEWHQSTRPLQFRWSTGPFHAKPDQQHLNIMSWGGVTCSCSSALWEWLGFWFVFLLPLRTCWCWRNKRCGQIKCSFSYF